MKDIGNKCGSWLENELETKLKNHLRGLTFESKGQGNRFHCLWRLQIENGFFHYWSGVNHYKI
ncbi:hypothetical protein KY289_036565 [Solanum tuberosum]|nr:hypothetical protein KY289_036565 [Solanum tuberosum]